MFQLWCENFNFGSEPVGGRLTPGIGEPIDSSSRAAAFSGLQKLSTGSTEGLRRLSRKEILDLRLKLMEDIHK